MPNVKMKTSCLTSLKTFGSCLRKCDNVSSYLMCFCLCVFVYFAFSLLILYLVTGENPFQVRTATNYVNETKCFLNTSKSDETRNQSFKVSKFQVIKVLGYV